MSRAEGSARPPYPPDAVGNRLLGGRWENDESVLLPMTDEQMRALEQAYLPIFGGEVLQPHCMCGEWSSVGECPKCREDIALFRRWDAEEQREREAREAWRKDRKPQQGDAA